MATAALEPLKDELYTALIEGAPAMLWLGDADGHCVFLNRAQRDFWGVRHRDLSDFDWGRTLHPDDVQSLFGPYSEAMAARQGFEVEARYRRADGAWRILQTSARPRFAADGRFIGMVGVNVDVTEQRRAEEALRRSTEHLRLALDASGGIGTWVWDVPADRVFADANFANTFGVEAQTAAEGTPVARFLDAIHAEDRDTVAATIDAALRSGGPFGCEFRVTAQVGRWFLALGECALDASGRPAQFPGVVVDITERHRREDELGLLTRELSHRIKNIFTVVSAMTSFAAKEDAAAEPALRKLGQRFQAMAAAYTLVTPSRESTEPRLHALFDKLFAPYGEAIEVNGPDLPLGESAASALALIFHERATNAAKYGALSADGRVVVAIDIEEEMARISWREIGGPAVPGAPDAAGFGFRLIEASLTSLDASEVADWTPAGLVLTLEVACARLAS